MRLLAACPVFTFLALFGIPAMPAADPPPTPAQQLDALKRQFKSADDEIDRAIDGAKTAEERHALRLKLHDVGGGLYAKAIALAEQHPNSPAAFDALSWIITEPLDYTNATGPAIERACDLLMARYITSAKLAPVCQSTHRFVVYSTTPEKFYRTVLDKNLQRDVRGIASFRLAEMVHSDAEIARKLLDPLTCDRTKTALTPVVLRKYQAGNLTQMAVDREREAESLFERVVTEFGDLKPQGDATLGERAQGKLYQIRNLGVGKTAPEIAGEDVDGRTLKLSEHRGQVVAVVFWATWCGPCMGLVPDERALVERMMGRPFVLLGVNADRDRAAARKVSAEQGITWRSWWNGGPDGSISRQWGVDSWPSVYVIDHRGVIRYHQVVRETLDKAVERLVTEAEGK